MIVFYRIEYLFVKILEASLCVKVVLTSVCKKYSSFSSHPIVFRTTSSLISRGNQWPKGNEVWPKGMPSIVILFVFEGWCIFFVYRRRGSSSAAYLHQLWDGIFLYGAMGRRSRAAETVNRPSIIVAMATPPIAVLRFHWGGFTHHPP